MRFFCTKRAVEDISNRIKIELPTYGDALSNPIEAVITIEIIAMTAETNIAKTSSNDSLSVFIKAVYQKKERLWIK